MSYGTSLGVTAPTVSVTAGPAYATSVNAFLNALRVVVEAKVTPGGFNMSSDLSFLSSGTFRSAVDLLTTSYEVQTSALSAVSYPAAMYFAGVNGEAYINDAAGNQVQLTSGGAVNVSTSGGITGTGYGSSSVAVNWSSGNQAYRFFAGASTYADVVCDDLLLNDGDTNFITIVSPALASDYTLTLPNAVPATSNSVLAMATSGVVTASATPTVTSLTTTANLAVGTTSAFTGKAAFSVEYSRPARVRHITAGECIPLNSDCFLEFGGSSDSPHYHFTADSTLFLPLRMEEGETLQSIVFWITQGDDASNRTFDIGYWNDTVGVWTWPGGGYATTSTSAANGSRLAVTLNNTDILTTNPAGAGVVVGMLMARMQGKFNATGDQFWGARVTTQRT